MQCRIDSVYLMLRKLSSHLCVLLPCPSWDLAGAHWHPAWQARNNPSPKPCPLAPVFFDSDQDTTLVRHPERLIHVSSMESVCSMLHRDEASQSDWVARWSLEALAVLSFWPSHRPTTLSDHLSPLTRTEDPNDAACSSQTYPHLDLVLGRVEYFLSRG